MTSTSTTKRKYHELIIDGPPLYCNNEQSSSTVSSEVDGQSHRHRNCPPLDASKTALLIVDVQPEYWSECPTVRHDFPNFPSHISSLIQNCRTQNIQRIIWVRADYSYEHSPWLHQFARLHEGKIPPIVRPSSKWEEFATPLDGEMIITKTSWSSTSGGTGLLDTLKQDGIDTVLVCGLITSVCVQHSAFGVFEAGYRTILVTDACADRGRERHEAALALYGDYMYELRSVESLRLELEEQQQRVVVVESDSVIEKKKKKEMMMENENEGAGSDSEEVMPSSIRKVSVALPSYKDGGGNNVGHRDKKMMIKSESNDSLTSATSVSSIEDHGVTVARACAEE
eukprot:CAMPEP_0201693644 /NCGR_PEP_ID=MMETSP0578-20130828/6176_1 /ASSEMBLY_ACC=CAM_ASM_000663 /TAXON_ID=267565 /ORGANISM="Skeletonema grethea, Strain CCMP 1804" /LENGTH=340 /DNA_ID=CAMNT_0048179209 /DNA_START=181 /DNA_END=1203 /DNA_ORIENTATION=+